MKNKILLITVLTIFSIGLVHAAEKTYTAGSGPTKTEACNDAERGALKKAIWHCEKIGGTVSSSLYKRCNARQYDSGGWTASTTISFECS
jgi:hypothetical protein